MNICEKIRVFLIEHPESSKGEISEGISFEGSVATLKRHLTECIKSGQIVSSGRGRGTRYSAASLRKYPDGVQTFEKIISEHYVYVDKTALIYQLAHTPSPCLFLSRPRRFGKSLLISTLQAYFEGRKDLFSNLAIVGLETEWEHYPVIRLDLSTAADALNSDQLYLKLGNILRENEERLGLPIYDTLPGERLEAMVRRAYKKSGKKVVLLVDEYDAPMLGALYDASNNERFRKIEKELFAPVKKLEPFLRFTFLTGITKFSQMSIFSTLNNLNDISMDDSYASLCGFTEKEVENCFRTELNELADVAGLSHEDILPLLQLKYDGYHFTPAGDGVFNPFSLLKVFDKKKLSDYWFSSGTPGVLIDALQKFDTDIYEIDGAEVTASLFNQPTESVDNALSLFYQSGYLTIKSYDALMDTYRLGIPNLEVRAGLMENLVPLILKKNPIESHNLAIRFKRSLIQGDIDQAFGLLRSFFASIPYPEFGKDASASFEKKEAYFKRLFYLVFSFMNIQIHTEVMNSEGRTDAVMFLGNSVYIIEAKLDAVSAREAVEQIDQRNYTTRFENGEKRVFKVGLNFSSKSRTLEEWIVEEVHPL